MNVPYISFQPPASGSILKDVLKSAKKSAVHAFLKTYLYISYLIFIVPSSLLGSTITLFTFIAAAMIIYSSSTSFFLLSNHLENGKKTMIKKRRFKASVGHNLRE